MSDIDPTQAAQAAQAEQAGEASAGMTATAVVDAAFVIGSDHLSAGAPCQDYALAGEMLGLSWAAVSDGCSTGGHTDVGARLWAHAVPAALRTIDADARRQLPALREALIKAAEPLLGHFQMIDALATLGVVFADSRGVVVALFGDGMVTWTCTEGARRLRLVEFEANAPRYLVYDMLANARPSAVQQWQEMVGESRVRIVDESGVTEQSAAAAYEGLLLDLGPTHQLREVALFSDGATTLPQQDMVQVARDLTEYPSHAGGFVHRRLARMSRDWRRDPQSMPRDDLSVACLCVLENQKPIPKPTPKPEPQQGPAPRMAP